MKHLVLASRSPRRRELLAGLGLSFMVRPSEVAESIVREDDPGELVEELARRKAETVAKGQLGCQEALVIGADTIVVLDGNVLEKPRDEPDAVAMLRQLSGRWHQVFTGVAVTEVPSGHTMHCHETTAVKFRALRASEIDAYVRTKEPLDKAGAYGIQGKGALLVERIDGCYFNVVGLPLVKLARLLARFGVDVWEEGERTGHEVPSDLERTTPR